jgi:hypothetical protein
MPVPCHISIITIHLFPVQLKKILRRRTEKYVWWFGNQILQLGQRDSEEQNATVAPAPSTVSAFGFLNAGVTTTSTSQVPVAPVSFIFFKL